MRLFAIRDVTEHKLPALTLSSAVLLIVSLHFLIKGLDVHIISHCFNNAQKLTSFSETAEATQMFHFYLFLRVP